MDIHSSDALPSTELDPAQSTIKRKWLSSIAEAALSPVSFIWSGINWGAETIERRIGQWRLKGEDERVSMSEMMTGEISTMIGVIAGALAGVCVTKLTAINSGSFWDSYSWYILLLIIILAIPAFYKWMRSQIWHARRSAWEPYVPAESAKQTLLEEWRNIPIKSKWDAAATCALKNHEFDEFLTFTDCLLMILRLGVGFIYAIVMLTLMPDKSLAGLFAIICIMGTCLGIILSQARDYCSVTARSKRFHARLSVLNQRLANNEEGLGSGNIIDQIDSLIDRLEKYKTK